jgi:amidohydrolase
MDTVTPDLDWTRGLTETVAQSAERIREARRHLHQHPEPSGGEVQTTRYLASLLASEQLEPTILPGGRGLWVDFGSAPSIGLRADIDALWIRDEKSVDYRSRCDGVMHACGHDAHSAIVYGAISAILRLDRAGKLPWPVACRAIFQPAEETNLGAVEMVHAGALDGLTDLISLHMDPSRPVGTIGVRHGDFTADCHEMKIEIHGRGAHAARPHEGVDPIAVAAQLISAIYLFVPRITDSQDAVVVTFGQIHGGHSSNVIPDHVVLRGTLRTLDSGVSEATIRHITRLARGLAEASESVIDIQWESGPPPVKNDAELVNLLTEAGRSVVGATNVHPIRRASMGGEDFANYLTKVRGAMFRLGCSPGPGPAPPLHNPLFDIDERSLAIGAQILAHAVIRWCDPKSPANTPSPGNTPAPTSLAP